MNVKPFRLLSLLALFATTLSAYHQTVDQVANDFSQQTQTLRDLLKDARTTSQAARQAFKAAKKLNSQSTLLCEEMLPDVIDGDEDWNEDEIDQRIDKVGNRFTDVQGSIDGMRDGMTFEIALALQATQQKLKTLEQTWCDYQEGDLDDFDDDCWGDEDDEDTYQAPRRNQGHDQSSDYNNDRYSRGGSSQGSWDDRVARTYF